MSFSVVTNISSLSAQAQLDKTTQLQIAPLEEAIKLLTILLAGHAANTGRFRLHA